jgi:anti-sigma factor RsiW
MKACARWAPMIGAREGELGEAEARGLAEHLAGCDACQARLADEQALSGMLTQALMGEANRRDFAAFSDGVMARLPKARPSTPPLRGYAQGERGRSGGWLTPIAAWVRHHRLAAAMSALAPAVAAVALVLYLGREQQPEFAVDVTSDASGAMVLETSEGPVVLLGDSDSEGT